MFFIAMLCIQEHSVERPTMREVVQMLSEFPHHSPSSSSSDAYQKGILKDRDTCQQKGPLDLLV